MRRWLPFLMAALVVVAAGVGARVWLSWSSERVCETFVPRTLAELTVEDRCVTIEGLAHYQVVLRQNVPGNLLVEERNYAMFPLLPADQPDARSVRAFIRSERLPEARVDFERMTIEGRVYRADSPRLPMGAEVELGRRGGYFLDDFAVVVEPDRVVSGDEVWERQPGQE